MNAAQLDEHEVFSVAIKLTDPEARMSYLAQVCSDNPTLYDRISALLRSAEKGSFLAGPVPEVSATIANDDPSKYEGIFIGPYKLLQKIGEGSFGVVYMAQQTHPVRRRVALKIVKPGMDSKDVVARFEAERQALALMDHPNIARVLDGGCTDNGRPYFVMDLVSGAQIDEYCDEERLTPTERIELYIQVCQAVHHAHLKGIVHRDLKPSNIMVVPNNGEPLAKVIDFGIAKALGEELTDKTYFTRFGQVIGTPQYMSPEQASLNGMDVDIRSDIYSLGVVLYELLAGRGPFTSGELSKGFEEMRRVIREDQPRKPSVQFATLDGAQATTVAVARGQRVDSLKAALDGEIDWIVMKAIEKSRTDRYESARALADDLARHLRGEPVEAGPPTIGYRLKKSFRRNRGAVLTGAAITSSLFVILFTSIIGWWTASTAFAREQRAAKDVRNTLDVVLLLLAKSGIDPNTDREYTVTDALKHLAARVKAGTELQKETEAELHLALGRAFLASGDAGSAKLHFGDCLEIASETWEESDGRVSEARRQSAYLNRSLDDLQNAIKIDRKVANKAHLIKSLTLAGRLAHAEGHQAVAKLTLEEAVELFANHVARDESSKKSFQFLDLPHLAYADVISSEQKQAADFRETGIRLAKQLFGDSDQEWLRTAISLQVVDEAQGAQHAFEIASTCETTINVAWLRTLGITFRRQCAFKEAEAAFYFGVLYSQDRNAHGEVGWCKANQARTRMYARDYEKAKAYFHDAANYTRKMKAGNADFLTAEFASFLMLIDRKDEAKSYFRHGLEQIDRSPPSEKYIAEGYPLVAKMTLGEQVARSEVAKFVQNQAYPVDYRSYVLARAMRELGEIPLDRDIATNLLEAEGTGNLGFSGRWQTHETYLRWMEETGQLARASNFIGFDKWVSYDMRYDKADPARGWIRKFWARILMKQQQYDLAKAVLEEAVVILENHPFVPDEEISQLKAMIHKCKEMPAP